MFFKLTRFRTLSSTVSQLHTLPSVQGTAVISYSFSHGVLTPSLKSVGPGFLADVGGPSLSVSVSLSLSLSQLEHVSVGFSPVESARKGDQLWILMLVSFPDICRGQHHYVSETPDSRENRQFAPQDHHSSPPVLRLITVISIHSLCVPVTLFYTSSWERNLDSYHSQQFAVHSFALLRDFS